MSRNARQPARSGRRPAQHGKRQRGKAPAGQRRKRRWVRWALLAGIIPAIIAGLALTVTFFVVFASVPLPDDIDVGATRVLDRDGREWATLASDTSRQDIDLADLPEHVALSVLAAEDRGYYDHVGIAPISIIRAAVANLAAGELAQGGSTITQQYVKNAVVGNDRTLVRKLREAALAIKMEQAYSKDEILEAYLNTIYWGRGAYGIEAAARTYFGVGANALTLSQSATLAGIIQAPEGLDPAEEPDAAERRRQYVLDGLVAMEALPRDVIEDARAQGLPTVSDRQLAVGGSSGGYYLDAVRRELADLVGDEHVFRGLTVTVEVDPDMQAVAERVMSAALAEQPFTGALVAVDPEDGAVRALVGGPDPGRQPYNAAVQSRRQSGSAFKAFTLAAFVDAGYAPSSRYRAPASRTVPDGQGGTTEIRNYGDRDRGVQSVREATWTSTNTVYVDVQEEVGAAAVVDMARRLGIPDDRDLPEVPSLTLGVAGVSPMDMASAYATLAAGGVRSQPRLVVKVVDADGEVLYDAEPEREPVMSSGDAFLVTDVLRGVVTNGTGGRAALPDRPAAGKTGTTNDFRDAWFTGYVPQLATAVWVGNLDNTPMDGVTGGSVPAEIWASFMAEVTAEMEVRPFPDADERGKEVIDAAGEVEEPTEEPTDEASPTPTDEPSDPGPTVDPECPEGVLGVVTGGECTPEDEPSRSESPASDEPSGSDPSDAESSDPDGSASEPSEPAPSDPTPTPTASDGDGARDPTGAPPDTTATHPAADSGGG